MLTGGGMSLRFLAPLGVFLLWTVTGAAPPGQSGCAPTVHGASDLDDDESDGTLEPAPDEEDGPSAPGIFTPRAPEPTESPDTPESI